MNFVLHGLPIKCSQHVAAAKSRKSLLKIWFERGDRMTIEVTGAPSLASDMHLTFVDCGRHAPPRFSVVSVPQVSEGARAGKSLDSGLPRENARR